MSSEPLLPVYLLHRYQTEAAAKVLGGLFYTYALRGDGQKITERIPGAEQRRALDALHAIAVYAAIQVAACSILFMMMKFSVDRLPEAELAPSYMTVQPQRQGVDDAQRGL